MHEYEDNWQRLRHEDGRVHMAIDELLTELQQLQQATTETVPAGFVTLPHGFGMIYPDQQGVERQHGPQVNELTDAKHRCPVAGTPYHKYVPVRIEAVTS